MIGRLLGKILHKKAPELLLDVNGVGYEILLPLSVFYKLPDIGKEVILHTHLAIREDEHVLYGFFEESERALFRELIKVTGIGPKTALAILSSATPELLINYIVEEDVAALEHLPGIGKKTAQRLLIETRDKLIHFALTDNTSVADAKSDIVTASPVKDAISALVALGYSPQKARQVVFKVKRDGANSEELIKLALKGI